MEMEERQKLRMDKRRLKALGNFKQMVTNNHVLLTEVNGGETIQVCKCINPHQLEHLAWMLSLSVSFFESNQMGKANRWIGYVQGVLSAKYGVGLEDLKSANRDLGDFRAARGTEAAGTGAHDEASAGEEVGAGESKDVSL